MIAKALSSGGFDANAGFSGAAQSKYGGKWRASGKGDSGTLTLKYNDGSTATYSLSMNGSKFLMDGKRWLREAATCQ